MKKNKGFIGIGLIIAIIVGVLAVGGAVYYKSKSSKIPVVDSNVADCLPTTDPYIKVLSPNGGETYTESQTITVKWESCNVKGNVFAVLETPEKNFGGPWIGLDVLNTGTTSFTLPSFTSEFELTAQPGKFYKIKISQVSVNAKQDESDNLFTITSPSTTQQIKNGDITCNYNSKYFVISRDDKKSAGSDILIKYKKTTDQIITCKYVVNNGDFELKNDGGQWFSVLKNNLLILDNGTGSGNRGLIIYDLNNRKKVFSDVFNSGEAMPIINNTITYWTDTHEKVTAQNCPEFFNQGSGGIVAHIVLDLSTLTKKDLGENRCTYHE